MKRLIEAEELLWDMIRKSETLSAVDRLILKTVLAAIRSAIKSEQGPRDSDPA